MFSFVRMDWAVRKIRICGIFAGLLSLFACNDKIDVQQAYDFGITTWYLQKTIKPGKPVEIRFYLTRAGFYADAEFSIAYVQIAGEGVVYDTGNTRLVNREFCALQDIADLQDGVFTLYYRSMSDKNSTLKFIIMDNFGQTRELQIEFENET